MGERKQKKTFGDFLTGVFNYLAKNCSQEYREMAGELVRRQGEYTLLSENYKSKERALMSEILEAIGADRRIKELEALVRHRNADMKRERSDRRKDLRIIFNSKPYGNTAIALLGSEGKVYFQNRKSIILAGRFRGQNLGETIDLNRQEKQTVQIGVRNYNVFPIPLSEGYRVILRTPGVFSRMKLAKERNQRPSQKLLEQFTGVAMAEAEACESRLDAKVRDCKILNPFSAFPLAKN